ncbi:MAG: beta-glucuronidase [Oscillospiraceae bacterium]|nr:beta-glucuronidase [Oscillospiraceae bacterium]
MTEKINLTGEKWSFLLSKEKPVPNSVFEDAVFLPSTVQQLKKPPVTDERSDGFLTDPYRFEGYALYERTVNISPKKEGCAVFLVLERTRTSNVWINGEFAGTRNSLCTAHRYDITDLVQKGENRITIMIDNVSCPVPGGHMTSQDTQTNWLGITGEVYIECRNMLRYENIRLFTDYKSRTVTVTGKITGGESMELTADVSGFPKKTVTVTAENPSFTYEMEGAALWSEHDPVTYVMNISSDGDTESISFGIRGFETRGTDFLVNGEKVFLRGKHDGMIFPMTGAAPTDTEGWLKVMKAAKDHGINHYRFHTCCPPDAAFRAADKLGIYMEPELPFWGTVEEEITEGQQYLIDEGFRILDEFGNHPSFFAMSMGNELWGSKERLNDILGGYKKHDGRPLYTQGSNNFQFWPCVVENDDFFVGVRFSKERLFRGSYAMCDAPLGHIQTDAPNSDYTYDAHIRPTSVSGEDAQGGTIEIQYGTGVKTVSLDNAGGEFVSEIPVVSHEVGQYFMYPDYNEIEKYTGVLKPYNLEIFRERLEKAGMLGLADKFFRASGRFAAECYKNEIETALRSKELSGFQLLDIQDFTGQGTALVGVLNSFMESKGVITPVEWRSFCSERVILGCLPKFVFGAEEKTELGVKLYTYGAKPDVDPSVDVRLTVDGEVMFSDTVAAKGSFKGGVFDIGTVMMYMPKVDKAAKAVLTLNYKDISNKYILWVYPETEISPSENAVTTSDWAAAKSALAEGKRVLFLAKQINEEKSVEGTYCTDFWNYPMFRSISESMNKPVPVGTLGLLIDNKHPSLAEFPSETYSTAQWYDIVTRSRTVILDGTDIDPIVRTIDNCERNHSLGTVFEVRTGGGMLLVCTADLDGDGGSLPCRQLLKSLTNYVNSADFMPYKTADIEFLDEIFT